ncbi:protein LLP homolog [Lineus longissimus]|uniref:protein LLP homolog n=1 Tax=Lineus longissimus TaxID=88925 RepID=UPI002B4D3B08
MAKSLRSKHKRKMRAIKRQKNAPKELEKLKKILGREAQQDVEMKELYTVTDAKTMVEKSKDGMDVDKEASKYNPKTMKDENGQYPPWMNQRKIKNHKMKLKKKTNSGPKKKRGRKGQAW